jgi:hypothetical protein
MRKISSTLHQYRTKPLKLQALFVPTLQKLTSGRPAAFRKAIPVKLSINDRRPFVKYNIFYKSSEIVILAFLPYETSLSAYVLMPRLDRHERYRLISALAGWVSREQTNGHSKLGCAIRKSVRGLKQALEGFRKVTDGSSTFE